MVSAVTGSLAMNRFRAVQAPKKLAFAFVVIVMSSCVANGVRTTPAGSVTHVAGAHGSAGGIHDGTAPSAANGSTTAYDNGVGHQAAFQVNGRHHHQPQQQGAHGANEEREEAMEIDGGGAAATGSRLPDCTHACGPCSPCRRVMVSLRCAEAAESCPVAYRCMCRGRFFRVPTL